MALSSATFESVHGVGSLTSWTRNCPMACAVNLCRQATIEWRSGGSWASGSDQTVAANPTRYLYDGYAHRVSKASTTGNTFLLIDFGAEVQFDFLAILGHNFSDLPGGDNGNIYFEIADSNDYNTNKVKIMAFAEGIGTDNRILIPNLGNEIELPSENLSLHDPLVWTARYFRIRFEAVPGGITPEIGEIYIGLRCQFSGRPNMPEDRYDYKNSIIESQGSHGLSSTIQLYSGARQISYEMATANVQELAEWKILAGSNDTLLFAESPRSDSNAMNSGTYNCQFYLMHNQIDYKFPLIDNGYYAASIAGAEIGSVFYADEVH
jgi:hypothetical protein